MQISFSLPVILNAIVIVLGLFAATGLFIKPENRQANCILAVFLVISSLWLCDCFMRLAGIYAQDADYYFMPIYYSFAFGPLIYFYTRSMVNSRFKFNRSHFVHFIPVLLQTSLYCFLSLQDYAYRLWYWQEVHYPFSYRLEFDGTLFSMAIYLFLSIRLLVHYQKWLPSEYADLSTKTLAWLRTLLVAMLVICLLWLVELILREAYDLYYAYDYTPLMIGLLTVTIAFKTLIQPTQREVAFTNDKVASESIIFDDATMKIIEERMVAHKDYLDPKLNLKDFANRCQLPQRTVSQYLNQKAGHTFHAYVNNYRIAAFIENVKDPKFQHLTLEGLAYECGFNSKATFNRYFKKRMGVTPSEFVSNLSES